MRLSYGENEIHVDPAKVSYVSAVKGAGQATPTTGTHDFVVIVDGTALVVEGYETFGAAQQDRNNLLERVNADGER